MRSVLQIINEEIQDFYSDWRGDDEPSLADKYYEKRGIATASKQEQPKINAELIGYVDKQWTTPITPIAVYKNPENLNGFASGTRGILISNGDFYVAQSFNAFHDNILQLLSQKGIVPLGSIFDYDEKYPEEFIAVVRTFTSNNFSQSTAYDDFPPYYEEMFAVAEKKHRNYTFRALST